MSSKKFAVLLLIGAFCGCDGKNAPEPEKPVIKKNSKESQKGNIATVNEPA
jgi:hypothetical protein